MCFFCFLSVVWCHAGCVVISHSTVAVQQCCGCPLSAPRIYVSTVASHLVTFSSTWLHKQNRGLNNFMASGGIFAFNHHRTSIYWTKPSDQIRANWGQKAKFWHFHAFGLNSLGSVFSGPEIIRLFDYESGVCVCACGLLCLREQCVRQWISSALSVSPHWDRS